MASIIKQINIAECLVKWLPGYNKWLKIKAMNTKISANIDVKIKLKTKLGQVTRKLILLSNGKTFCQTFVINN